MEEQTKPSIYLFDCDGVILDSNSIKTDVFYQTALPYGKSKAKQLVDYHQENGGVSRYIKYHYFLTNILNKSEINAEHSSLLCQFKELSIQRMLSCPITPGALELLQKNKDDGIQQFVISGGAENDLKEIFSKRNLAEYFENIYGSPRTKTEIFEQVIEKGLNPSDAIYIGDSRYDYEVAKRFGVNFIFMYKYTEFMDWEAFFMNINVQVIESLSHLAKTKL
jgi:phosphoglycolate phosphatase-like HAD superfamily hydrolase